MKKFFSILLILVSLIGSLSPRVRAQDIYTTYLPVVAQDAEFLTDEQVLLKMIRTDSHQGRSSLDWNEKIASVAKHLVDDWAVSGVNPCVPDGIKDTAGLTVNELLRAAGVTLPDHYSQRGNNVATAGCGYSSPTEVWKYEGNTPRGIQNDHTLGQGFWNDQTLGAVGHSTRTASGGFPHYWIVITVPPAQ